MGTILQFGIVNGNGKELERTSMETGMTLIPMGKIPSDFFYCYRSALGRRPILCTVALFRHNCTDIFVCVFANGNDPMGISWEWE